MTATAALTAQNTQGVYGIHETPPSFVQKQIDACLDDIGADVLKTGRTYLDTRKSYTKYERNACLSTDCRCCRQRNTTI